MGESELAGLSRGLVGVPSHEGPAAAGDHIESWLHEHTDAAVGRDPDGNVVARRGDGPSLALVGHHDVVQPEKSQADDGEYRVECRNGRLYGRGSADMKGALAAMLLAFRDAEPGGELVFASFVGEEQGGVGCRAALDRGFAPDYAVVGEGSTGYSAPGTTDVAVAHKGRRGSTLVATGESAHASEPGAGENAVYRACDAVDRLRRLGAPATTIVGERVEGSLTVTEIGGGESWNTVPERCEVTVDERTVPGERADLAFPETEHVVDQDLPPMRCSERGFADAALAAAREVGPAEQVVKPHATDAGWLAGAGVACVVCGPAEPGEAHTGDESVSLDALDRCRRVYGALAEADPAAW
jgi:acetylornithine deacetylase